MNTHARHVAITLLAAAMLAMTACATGPTVRTDHDPTANFTQYQSWGFYSPIAMEQAGYSTWMSDRIKSDIRSEMEARGYRYNATAPDLLVNFQHIVEDKTQVWSVPQQDMQWFYNYRSKRYFAVPVWYDQTQISRYREGTLTIDLVDARKNRMVWTGSAIGSPGTGLEQAKREAKLDRAVTGIFAKYPHRADAAPTTD